MRKAFATLLLYGTIVPFMATLYTEPLDLARRDRNGTLERDIIRVQTYNGKLYVRAKKTNLREVRKVIRCGVTPEDCTGRRNRDQDYLDRTRMGL